MSAKGTIIHVGDWDDEHDRPNGWVFENCDYGIQMFLDGREPLCCGYTLEELRAILAAHQASGLTP